MDLLDRKILGEIDLNCRASYATVAHRLRTSRAVVNYRVRNIEHQGIIKKYVTAINLGKLGFSTYKLYFKLFGYDKKERQEFLTTLTATPSVIHCIRTQGAFDITIVVATKSINELDVFIAGLKNRFASIIREYRLSIIVSSKVFDRKKIVLGRSSAPTKIENFSGSIGDWPLDDKDMTILSVLSHDASLSTRAIARKTKLSIDVIHYRIKKLLDNGIINNFRILFDINKLGYHHYVFLINTLRATHKDEGRLVTWCEQSQNVMYLTKRVGFWEYELNVALHDIEDFNVFVDSFETEFSSIIDSYETIINTEVLKLVYFPFNSEWIS